MFYYEVKLYQNTRCSNEATLFAVNQSHHIRKDIKLNFIFSFENFV